MKSSKASFQEKLHNLKREQWSPDASPKSPKLLTAFSSKNRLPKQENKVLVKITVLGSAGPLRALLDMNTTVEQVVEIALRNYATEGRLPTLGNNSRLFELYCNDGEYKALAATQWIGELPCRHFLLYCKKQPDGGEDENELQARKMICWCSN